MKELFNIRISQADEHHLSGTCDGNILLSPTVGGEFSGITSGRVEPIGMMMTQAVHPGKHNQNVQLLLTDDEGEQLLVDVRMFADWSEEVEKMITCGENFDRDYYAARGEFYAGGTAQIRSGSDKYSSLQRKVLQCEFDVEDWSTYIVKIHDPSELYRRNSK